MIIERFRDNDIVPVYKRVRDEGRMLPEGLRYVDSWVEANFGRCFQLMECDDLRLIQEWVLKWRGGGVDFEIVPVDPQCRNACDRSALSRQSLKESESMIDIAKVRADTRGCEQVIHFNNAGSSLPPAPVVDAVIAHLKREEEFGGYEAAALAEPRWMTPIARSPAHQGQARRDRLRRECDAGLGHGVLFARLQAGRPHPHGACRICEQLHRVSADRQEDRCDRSMSCRASRRAKSRLQRWKRMIDERVKLIAITHVPTNGGLVNPAAEIGKIARAHGIPYLLDACQSVGQLAIDVEAIGCDMLSATGRKYLRGPRGTGFLYVKRNLIERLEPLFLDLHAAEWMGPDRYDIRKDARRFENWERYVAGQIGLGVAADYALDLGACRRSKRASRNWRRDCAARFRGSLASISRGYRSREMRDRELRRGGREAGAIKHALGTAKINVSVSSASSTLLDMEARGLAQVVRASVHYYNNEDEVDRFARAVAIAI